MSRSKQSIWHKWPQPQHSDACCLKTSLNDLSVLGRESLYLWNVQTVIHPPEQALLRQSLQSSHKLSWCRKNGGASWSKLRRWHVPVLPQSRRSLQRRRLRSAAWLSKARSNRCFSSFSHIAGHGSIPVGLGTWTGPFSQHPDLALMH